jgi:TM2 domain-containing membrane protein YozV
MNNRYLIGVISWLLPGVGHFLQGRVKRGLIIGSVIWTMFIIAVLSGGAYYPGFDFKDGSLLYLLNIFARLGNGLGVLISFFLTTNPIPNVASWATFEYGGRFLEIAGLLNYLAVLDAIDIQLGRKK